MGRRSGRRQLASAKPARLVYRGTASMAERWDDARVVYCNGRGRLDRLRVDGRLRAALRRWARMFAMAVWSVH